MLFQGDQLPLLGDQPAICPTEHRIHPRVQQLRNLFKVYMINWLVIIILAIIVFVSSDRSSYDLNDLNDLNYLNGLNDLNDLNDLKDLAQSDFLVKRKIQKTTRKYHFPTKWYFWVVFGFFS